MISAFSIARLIFLLIVATFFLTISSIASAQEATPDPNNLPGEVIGPNLNPSTTNTATERPVISWWWLLPLLLVPLLFFLPSKRKENDDSKSEYAYHDIDDDLDLDEDIEDNNPTRGSSNLDADSPKKVP